MCWLVWLNLGGSPEGQGHLRPVSGGLEGENPVSEADTEPPVARSRVRCLEGGAPFWASQ